MLRQVPVLPTHIKNRAVYVVDAWKTLNQSRKPRCIDQILSYPLWEVENIKVGGSSVFFKNWARTGIWTAHDLLDYQSKIISFQNFPKILSI